MFPDTFRLLSVDAGIVVGGNLLDSVFERIRNIEAIYKSMDFVAACFCAGTGKRLEGFVRMRKTFGTQNCLDGFRHHGPVVFQILLKVGTVEKQFADALLKGTAGEEHMCQRHADIAADGGVGQIPLHA